MQIALQPSDNVRMEVGHSNLLEKAGMANTVERTADIDTHSDRAARRFDVVEAVGDLVDERKERRRRRVERLETVLGGRSR